MIFQNNSSQNTNFTNVCILIIKTIYVYTYICMCVCQNFIIHETFILSFYYGRCQKIQLCCSKVYFLQCSCNRFLQRTYTLTIFTFLFFLKMKSKETECSGKIYLQQNFELHLFDVQTSKLQKILLEMILHVLKLLYSEKNISIYCFCKSHVVFYFVYTE